MIQNHFEVPIEVYVCILTLSYSKSQYIQTELIGPLDFELSRYDCTSKTRFLISRLTRFFLFFITRPLACGEGCRYLLIILVS